MAKVRVKSNPTLPQPQPQPCAITLALSLTLAPTATLTLALSLTQPGGTRLAAINPNILVHGDTLLLAARAHALQLRTDVGQWNNDVVTQLTTVWQSEILLGEAPLDAAAWEGWDVQQWGLSSPSLARARLLSSAAGEGVSQTQPYPDHAR